MIRKRQTGFTIVELMIATVVFSLLLIVCLATLVQISRAYYKGITQARTQDTARSILEEISNAIQFSGTVVKPTNTISGPRIDVGQLDTQGLGAFCAGNKLYNYAIDRRVKGSGSDENQKIIQHAMVSYDTSCTDTYSPRNPVDVMNDTNPLVVNKQSLLGDNIRITRFNVQKVSVATELDAIDAEPIPITQNGVELWRIELALAYGDNDLIEYTDSTGADKVVCKTGRGDEFCSIVEYNTVIMRRISN